MKVCSKCKLEKSFCEFGIRKGGCGYKSQCKSCCKNWYREHREGQLLYKKQYYQEHKDERQNYPSHASRSEYGKIYRAEHREDTARRNKEFRQKNPDYVKCWYSQNINARREYARKWAKEQRLKPEFRILDNTRRRVRSALAGRTKSSRTKEILGCEPAFLKDYLASKFQLGMSWDNYGEWEIDHIQPCSRFDLTNGSELKACFNYTNLQPLWLHENRVKSDKV